MPFTIAAVPLRFTQICAFFDNRHAEDALVGTGSRGEDAREPGQAAHVVGPILVQRHMACLP